MKKCSSADFSFEPLEARTLLSAAQLSDLSSWTGTVTRVVDGDTILVDVADDGLDKPVRVRFIGIQAMEIGDAKWEAPTNRLKKWILGKSVTLRAEFATSSGQRERPLRFVYHDINGDGAEEDVGLKLLKQGLVFAFPSPKETFNNTTYIKAGNRAADAQRGLWNPDYCGVGPAIDAKMWVNWDAQGGGEDLNGEWVRIRNLSDEAITFGAGWQVRDSALNIYHVPEGTSLGAGQFLTVKVGSGDDNGETLHWGLDSAVFDNEVGDGAYLIDPLGNIRAHFTYPRLSNLTDPLQGKLRITANVNAVGDDGENPNGEWINIKNISDHTVDLAGYLIVAGTFSYDIGYDDDLPSIIGPAETMRIYVGKGVDSPLKRYWGMEHGILDNSEGSLSLQTFDAVTVETFEWDPSTAWKQAVKRLTGAQRILEHLLKSRS